MKKQITRIRVRITIIMVVIAHVAFGQLAGDYIGVINMPTGNRRIVLFDLFDGSIVQDPFINLEQVVSGTPKDFLQVGDEIWVADQTRDRVDRYSLSGAFIDSIGGMYPGSGLDNLRGLGRVGNEVWLSNSGTQNGAPGNAVIRISLTGEILGHFTVGGSPWDFIVYNNEVLLSFSAAGSFLSQIHRYDFSGNALGPWNAPGELNFIQQISIMNNNNVLAAAFSNVTGGNQNGIYQYNPNGVIVGPIAGTLGTGPRGCYQLGNGNILWTNGSGIHIADISTGTSTLIMSGSSQFMDVITISSGTVIPGDANCDGSVSILDVISIANYIMGLNPEPFCFENADINGDGVVNLSDLISTVNIIMGTK